MEAKLQVVNCCIRNFENEIQVLVKISRTKLVINPTKKPWLEETSAIDAATAAAA